ncbi:hypothetical protein P9E76_07250 [Schinkia azotoformans]|uniref:Uncharacterized protein n=1 Tax=Schinkia azotoformans LMG 9581 TaxID=1131731 RepID=K6BZK6_SCHAZ|nr:hypothetical protein [Schinkia azotoformans]EKN64350.1 hypothetical protein BAZO_14179 [Schinkia azotoformans LMG 9581]MEC1637942.1 hypothetical protein [Schinkia azotoformans]MEC1721666.1 hypothetical protein [Schinkia azotoformans]MEC1944839.1 hypothetical protein [Schinkia azotoformans]MED4415068.1 hypothetical protein [Schinkia azotoformans]
MIKYLFIITLFLYVLTEIFPSMQLSYVLSILCMVIIVSTLFYVKRFVKILGIVFLLIGALMLFTSGASWKTYIISFGPMLNLLTLFSIIPILAIPIQIGNYAGGIQELVNRKLKNSGHLYMLTSGISYFLSIFMNLATLPMTYHSMKPALQVFSLQSTGRFMSRAITRGFAMPLLWAPVTPIVGIVIEMTGVSWSTMLPYLLPLSIAGLLLDWFLAGRAASKLGSEKLAGSASANEIATTIEVSGKSLQSPKRIGQILVAILIFNICIAIFDYVFHLSFLILVALLVIPFAFCWSFLLKKGREFLTGLQIHTNTYLYKMKDQFFIFLSAGFFISAMQFSGTDHRLNEMFVVFKGLVGIEMFLLMIPVIPLILAFTGLHPAVALALLAETLDPTQLGISPQILTVSMLGGAVSAFLMGPYNATIGLMSGIINESPFKISNWNAPFTVLYLLLVMVYLIILNVFI